MTRSMLVMSLAFFGGAVLASAQDLFLASSNDLLRTKVTGAAIEEDGPVKSPHSKKTLDPNRITCPVLAAMVAADHLHPDEYGSITLEDMHDGVIATGGDESTASFFAVGVIMYPLEHKETQLHRDRCFPGSPCFMAKMQAKGNVTKETERYLNIYTMNGVQTVEHGFSTGTRGGWNNPPVWEPTLSCNGVYPCEAQWKKFWEPCADSQGRFYRDNILCVICKAQAMGDRGGEWSFNPYSKHTAWQMSVATLSMLAGWGRLPTPTADPFGPDTHFTTQDMRQLVMDGVYPDNWVKRNWSNITMIKYLTETKLPCDNAYGETQPWWGDSSCPSDTKMPCAPVFGHLYPEGCPAGSTCMDSGFCVCGRGSNGISMCANDKGQCVERVDKCTYFGEPCTNTVADNPAAPW